MTRLTHEEQLKLGGDIQRRLGIKTSRGEALAHFSTMRVGGPADLLAEVRNLFELRALVRFARTRDIPLFLIGRGSDLVISDAGIRGLVVVVRSEGHRVDGQRFVAEAGKEGWVEDGHRPLAGDGATRRPKGASNPGPPD